jgi:RNA polymerase II subunit A small phosphatase-like protein
MDAPAPPHAPPGHEPPSPGLDSLLLVLDLDETLVHASEVELGRPADFRVHDYHVYRRPHLQAFLDHVLARFQVGVWTSSSPRYAEAVVAAVFPPRTLRFVWASPRCSLSRDWISGHYLPRKRLAKLKRHGYRLERMLAVDDTPSKHAQNYGNLVCVREFLGEDEHDDELLRLMAYLDTLAAVGNVRRIEKRRWRERAHAPGLPSL